MWGYWYCIFVLACSMWIGEFVKERLKVFFFKVKISLFEKSLKDFLENF